MQGCFDVILLDQSVGKAIVNKIGLYYEFECECQLPMGSRYHLLACSDEDMFDLGLCIPLNNRFVLHTRIPVKYFVGVKYHYCLVEKKEKQKFPLDSNTPFPDLCLLKDCYLDYIDGKPFAFKDQ